MDDSYLLRGRVLSDPGATYPQGWIFPDQWVSWLSPPFAATVSVADWI